MAKRGPKPKAIWCAEAAASWLMRKDKRYADLIHQRVQEGKTFPGYEPWVYEWLLEGVESQPDGTFLAYKVMRAFPKGRTNLRREKEDDAVRTSMADLILAAIRGEVATLSITARASKKGTNQTKLTSKVVEVPKAMPTQAMWADLFGFVEPSSPAFQRVWNGKPETWQRSGQADSDDQDWGPEPERNEPFPVATVRGRLTAMLNFSTVDIADEPGSGGGNHQPEDYEKLLAQLDAWLGMAPRGRQNGSRNRHG